MPVKRNIISNTIIKDSRSLFNSFDTYARLWLLAFIKFYSARQLYQTLFFVVIIVLLSDSLNITAKTFATN